MLPQLTVFERLSAGLDDSVIPLDEWRDVLIRMDGPSHFLNCSVMDIFRRVRNCVEHIIDQDDELAEGL
jgi:hypothetical protein